VEDYSRAVAEATDGPAVLYTNQADGEEVNEIPFRCAYLDRGIREATTLREGVVSLERLTSIGTTIPPGPLRTV
jgi:hypothetical protein